MLFVVINAVVYDGDSKYDKNDIEYIDENDEIESFLELDETDVNEDLDELDETE